MGCSAGKILVIPNIPLKNVAGGAALITRINCLKRHGWDVDILEVNPKIFSILKCLKIFKNKICRNDYDIVWSMNNPVIPHLFPLFFKKHYKSNINFKWLAELRDPIYYNPDPRKRFVKSFYRYLEHEIVRYADKIVISRGLQIDLTYFSYEYGYNAIKNKIEVIPYLGFNPNDFKQSGYILQNIQHILTNNKFIICYAGKFYKGWTDPISFFYGFKEFILKERLTPNDVSVLFFGDWYPEYTKILTKLELTKYIIWNGWIERTNLIPILQRSNLLLYIGGHLYENRKNISLKIWDYIGVSKPILALCRSDYEVSKFILKNNFGFVARYDDPTDISDKLSQIYKLYIKNEIKKMLKKYTKNRMKYLRNAHDEAFVKICERMLED